MSSQIKYTDNWVFRTNSGGYLDFEIFNKDFRIVEKHHLTGCVIPTREYAILSYWTHLIPNHLFPIQTCRIGIVPLRTASRIKNVFLISETIWITADNMYVGHDNWNRLIPTKDFLDALAFVQRNPVTEAWLQSWKNNNLPEVKQYRVCLIPHFERRIHSDIH